jgi:hypothetical protein
MKNIFLFLLLSSMALLGAGCKNISPENSLTPIVAPNTQTETSSSAVTEPTQPTTTPSASATKMVLYHGSWFDIRYPEHFIFSPTIPVHFTNGNTIIETDEATFVSPDKTVEFFIFSPLWSGDPIDYLQIKNTEELVSEKISTTTDPNGDKKVTRWVTLKAKDSSYYRSFISIKNAVDSGSETHHVFGVKYKNEAAYEKYKNDYLKFKESLRQYSD